MLASATSEVIVSTLMEEFGYNEEEQKKIKIKKLERAKGIEPSYRAWEALVLPLNYARFDMRKAL